MSKKHFFLPLPPTTPFPFQKGKEQAWPSLLTKPLGLSPSHVALLPKPPPCVAQETRKVDIRLNGKAWLPAWVLGLKSEDLLLMTWVID